MKDTLHPEYAKQIREAATDWREEHPNRPVNGYVYLKDGGEYTPIHWSQRLEPACDFRRADQLDLPHYAVDPEENILKWTGSEWQNVAQTTLESPLPAFTEPESLTGGEIAPKEAHRYRAMRKLICEQPDVSDLLALSWIPDQQRWLYLVRTPTAWTYPKYVVGTVDEKGVTPKPIFRCGTPKVAWTKWHNTNSTNVGDHL